MKRDYGDECRLLAAHILNNYRLTWQERTEEIDILGRRMQLAVERELSLLKDRKIA